MGHDAFDFPKAELHCHLDGTYRLVTIVEMARRRNVPLPSYDPAVLSRKVCVLKKCESLDEYLKTFHVITPTFAGCKASLKQLAIEAAVDKAGEGVRYIEFRYCPQLLCGDKKQLTCKEVITTINEGFKEGTSQAKTLGRSIIVRSILCTIINHPEWSMEIAKLCKEFQTQGVVGMDVAGAGDKKGKMILKHKEAFVFCKQNDIGRTAHAGEKGGPMEVKVAVEELSAQRIGHGYKVYQDKVLYKECIKKGIHFEVCPLSSYLTASVDDNMEKHPAIQFMNDRASFSLNTDDPGVQQSNLSVEYEVASNSFNFNLQQIHQTNISALKAAFVEKSLKCKLIHQFEEAYKKYMSKILQNSSVVI